MIMLNRAPWWWWRVEGGGEGGPPQRCGVEPSGKVKYLVYLVFGRYVICHYIVMYIIYIYLCTYTHWVKTGWYCGHYIEVTKQFVLHQGGPGGPFSAVRDVVSSHWRFISQWKTRQPCLERMIGGCLDWASLRSLILQFVIHHKSSRPNTVNLSFPYHLLWSFIQITMIAFSWPGLAGRSPLTRQRWEMEGGRELLQTF